MKDKPIIRKEDSKRTDDVELSQIDEDKIDVYTPEGMKYPIIERLNNGLTWPEGGPKGGIDMIDIYEISSIPKDPDTPLVSVKFLEEKGAMPKKQ